MSSPADLDRPRPRLLPLALFTLLYMVGAVATAVASGNKEFVFYIVVMVVLIAVVMIVHRRSNLSSGLLWALSVWGLLHMAGGLMPIPETWPRLGDQAVLYCLWLIPGLLKYDQIVHAYGFGVTTLLCWHAIHHSLRDLGGAKPKPTLGLLVLCAAGGMGFGALNEVVEFIAVLTIPNTNVGGYENTGWDMVSNLLGSALAAIFIKLKSSRAD